MLNEWTEMSGSKDVQSISENKAQDKMKECNSLQWVVKINKGNDTE